jgi:hypothetical protein
MTAWTTALMQTIDHLTKVQQEWLGMVAIGLSRDIPIAIARALERRELIEHVPFSDHWVVASVRVHYAWCVWCSRQKEEE